MGTNQFVSKITHKRWRQTSDLKASFFPKKKSNSYQTYVGFLGNLRTRRKTSRRRVENQLTNIIGRQYTIPAPCSPHPCTLSSLPPSSTCKINLRRLERVFRCYSVCETMKDAKEGYFIVWANYKYLFKRVDTGRITTVKDLES